MSIWTPELDATILQLRKQGLSAARIADTLRGGITRNAVIGRLERLRMAAKRRNPISRGLAVDPALDLAGNVLAMHKAGHQGIAIAKVCKVSPDQVGRILKKASEDGETVTRREQWTAAREAKLRELVSLELPTEEISRQTGMSADSVRDKMTRMGIAIRRKRGQDSALMLAMKAKIAAPQPPLEAAETPRPMLFAAAWAPLPGARPISIDDLRLTTCRWPVGDPVLYCGLQTGKDAVYCPFHGRLSARKAGFDCAEAA